MERSKITEKPTPTVLNVLQDLGHDSSNVYFAPNLLRMHDQGQETIVGIPMMSRS